MKFRILLACVVTALTLAAPVALASSTRGAPATTSHAGLPFSGFDLLLLIGAAVALLALGFGLRRLAVNVDPLAYERRS